MVAHNQNLFSTYVSVEFSELPKTTQPLHIPFLGSHTGFNPAQDSWLLSRLPVGLIFVKCSTRQHRETLRRVVSLSRGSRLLRDSPTGVIYASLGLHDTPTNVPPPHPLQSPQSSKSSLSDNFHFNYSHKTSGEAPKLRRFIILTYLSS